MRTLGVADAVVFGYSLGGMVAQELARRHPQLVGRLALGATAAYPIAGTVYRLLAKLGFWLGRALARISTVELAYLSLRVVERTAGLRPEHHRWMWTSLLRRDPTLFYEAGHAAWRFDSREWVGRLRVPTTVIVNDRDTVVRVDRQRELASLIPNAEVVELSDAGHESVISQPDRYLDLLRDLAKR
jgi:pimeloyl-ACP methyl ester carboxylesterase